MKQKFLLGVLLMTVGLTNSGCFALLLGAAAGAGGITYMKGAYEQNFDRPVAKVYRATIKALNKHSMAITHENIQKHAATVEFSSNDGKSGKIEITALTERASKISVRVGVFGDETLSRIILTSVEANL